MLNVFDNHPVAGIIVGSIVAIGAMAISAVAGELVGGSALKLLSK